jgi:carbon-monoxide dehydrogenase medium subunit
VKPAPFVYHAPRSVAEALTLAEELSPHDARFLAGGQSLVPMMAFRLARPEHLIDINGIAELNSLATDQDHLVIGACVRHAAFCRPVTSGPLGALLAAVCPHIAHYPIRTRGTFCGSLAHADPASEWCLVAVTLGAKLILKSARSTRTVEASEFFKGPMTTAADPEELLAEARLPVLRPGTGYGFYEFARRAGDFALAMSLVILAIEDGIITEARVGIGAVEGRPRRLVEVESYLVGKRPDEAVIAAAADVASLSVRPTVGHLMSLETSRSLVRTVTHRAVQHALT